MRQSQRGRHWGQSDIMRQARKLPTTAPLAFTRRSCHTRQRNHAKRILRAEVRLRDCRKLGSTLVQTSASINSALKPDWPPPASSGHSRTPCRREISLSGGVNMSDPPGEGGCMFEDLMKSQDALRCAGCQSRGRGRATSDRGRCRRRPRDAPPAHCSWVEARCDPCLSAPCSIPSPTTGFG
jgi:hypothetical protein